jgi:DNA-directed RNA polymerase specialized sigma24 family protein
MPLPLRPRSDSVSASEVTRNVVSRDRTSAVTALFEVHYVSLVRMARLLVDDRETAEDVVMDAFTRPKRRRPPSPSAVSTGTVVTASS